MTDPEKLITDIFSIRNDKDFEFLALELFRFQSSENQVYKEYLRLLNIDPLKISNIRNIPFLPVSIFKTRKIQTSEFEPEIVFKSSGTKEMKERSIHYIKYSHIYRTSYLKSFSAIYGDPANLTIFALLPSYMDNKESSLIYMVKDLISLSNDANSGFFLNNYGELSELLSEYDKENRPCILFGVSHALLDLAEQYPADLTNIIVIETGGMKGRRKELSRTQLHDALSKGLGVKTIHSEYGMAELLSQAYSTGNGIYFCPPWMKILIRDINDPFSYIEDGVSGGVNIIDLANIYSCSFIETQDMGRNNKDGSFEITGRIENCDLRGCNLLIE